MTNTPTPLPVEQADELQQKTWELLLKVMSEGERHKLNSDILTPYHTQLLELLAAQATAAQERAYIRGQRDLLEKIIETPSNGTYHVSFFEDLLASLPKPEQKEQEQK